MRQTVIRNLHTVKEINMFIWMVVIGTVVTLIVIYLVNQAKENSFPPQPTHSYTPTYPSSKPPMRQSPDPEIIRGLWQIHASGLLGYFERMKSIHVLSEDIVFESLTALYIISLSFSNNRLDASAVLSDFYMDEVFEEGALKEYKSKFWPRVALYSKTMSSKNFRHEVLPDMSSSKAETADKMSQIMMIYTDLIWNPTCAENYQTAPIRENDTLHLILFQQDLDGLLNFFSSFAESWDNYTQSLG